MIAGLVALVLANPSLAVFCAVFVTRLFARSGLFLRRSWQMFGLVMVVPMQLLALSPEHLKEVHTTLSAML